MLGKSLKIVIRRVTYAFSIIPPIKTWIFAFRLLVIFALIILPLGFISNFLSLEFVHLPGLTVSRFLVLTLVVPALVEEMFFRVILLPHKSESTTFRIKCFWGSISLTSYIFQHPLNAVTFYPSGFPTFFHPVFLLATALLGLICMIVYWTSGSVWPPVIIHWFVVVVW